MQLAIPPSMNCMSIGSVIFVLACSGPRSDDRTSPTTMPATPPAPVAEPAHNGDGGTLVTPPSDPDPPVDVPHGAVRHRDQTSEGSTLFAQPPQPFPDAGVSIARQDGGVDAGAPDAARGPRDAGAANAPGRDAGRDAR